MRIHDLPGHKPSQEWINKTDLEIYSAKPEKEGYYIRHGNKGIIFWGIDAETVLQYLDNNYMHEGFRTMVCCDFDAGQWGRVQGSQEEPLTLELQWQQEQATKG